MGPMAAHSGIPAVWDSCSVGLPVLLTSPQGVLSILGHGIGFIQDDKLEAFPRRRVRLVLEKGELVGLFPA